MSTLGGEQGTRTLAALCVLTATLALVASHAAASATRAALSPEANTSALGHLLYPPSFTVEGSNGYSAVVVGTPAHKRQPSRVLIVVNGKRDGAFYSAPATVSETSIQASLGTLGEIAVTFHPSGQPRVERSPCSKKAVAVDSGYYEGTITFHGEEGFTEVNATRAPGDVGLLLEFVCPGISGGRGGPFMPGAELDLNENSHKPGSYLMVVKNRPSAAAHYEVGISELRDGVGIDRFASLIAPASTFDFDPKVQTATLRPPAPFSGSARFDRNAKPANRWTGDLTVDLPGRAGVKLTGPRIRASLAHAKWDWSDGSR